MFKSYLRIAWKNLLKHKSFSLINIIGLAIGLAACMIIFLYVQNEFGYDRYNSKTNRIFRVATTFKTPDEDVRLAFSSTVLSDILKNDYPEVEATVRLEQAAQSINRKQEIYREPNFYRADQDVFTVFDFKFIEGTAREALVNPQTIVLTKDIARKYFGSERALGKSILCNQQPFLVTGVVENRPPNSDMTIEALLSANFSENKGWLDGPNTYMFILFYKQPDINKFETRLADISKKYVRPALDAQGAFDYTARFELTPLAAVHFSAGRLGDLPKGNRQVNYIFSILAFFILLIALLNYINLSTAKSIERAREVGIRKAIGARRTQLMQQFLLESFLLVTISSLIALAIVSLGLPFFNRLFHTSLKANWAENLLFVSCLFLISFILAGLYPAFILSSFQPIKVLKGSWRDSRQGMGLRKLVTIIQFTIAAALIMGTIVIYRQMQFVSERDLGYDKTGLMTIDFPDDSLIATRVRNFADVLRQRPEVENITVGSPMTTEALSFGTTFAESEGKRRELMCNYYLVDPNYLDVFKIQLLEGRNLSDEYKADKTEGFLVNEAFLKNMGWKTGLGKSIEGFNHKGKIVGVVKNFYYKSLHNLVEPLILIYNQSPRTNGATLRIKPVNLPIIRDLFRKDFPGLAFDYSFFEDMVSKNYERDRITMSLFNWFSILAIFISCMGLYGLVALVSVQRTREIAIRKVLGSSLQQLFSILAKDFLQLICLALLIALPLAGFFMNKWLDDYAYHVQITWWMYLIPVALVLVVSIAVMAKEIIRVALKSPARSLRTD